jgi:hypothetical protein
VDLWTAVPIPAFLLLSAVVLLAMHARAWRLIQQQEMDDAEQDYHRRQFRRRMQSSGMLGLLAVGILVGQVIARAVPLTVLLVFWGGIVLLVIWVLLLAVADIVATKYHYGRLREGCLIEQAKLRAQLRRVEDPRRNGHSAGPKHRRDRAAD